MAGKREKPEEIVSKLRQFEVLQGQGATIVEAVRQIGGISELEVLGFIDVQAPSEGRMTNLYTLVFCPEDRARKREARLDSDHTRNSQNSRRKSPRRK